MDQETLFESLVRWNFWGKRNLPILKQREIMKEIISYVEDPFPVVLTGVRRSGKSSLFYLLMKHLLEKGVDRSQILLINFEEPLFSTYLSIPFLEKLITLYKERVNPDKKIFFFLDEIQNLPDWQKWVRREADLKEHKIFLTGSSSKLLSSEISTLLTGRYYSFSVFPLSFREFLKWQGIGYSSEIERVENKPIIRKAFSQYLHWGGFPEIVLIDSEERQKKILYQYFDDILFRDVIFRYQIRDAKLLQGIAQYYLTNVASLHSFNRIRNIFSTSVDNVRRYSTFLEESFLIFFLPRFSFKLSEQQKSNRKVYASDTGLRNVIGFRFSSDTGKLAENTAALHLLKISDELYYFANSGECDFITRKQDQFEAIQVCLDDLSEEKVRKREIRGLITAMRTLGQNRGTIFTNDMEKEEKVEDVQIIFRPLWKYLID